jgi:hypothetical protein
MQCDHQPMMWRKRLDFVSPGSMAMKPAAKLEEEKDGSAKKSCVAT